MSLNSDLLFPKVPAGNSSPILDLSGKIKEVAQDSIKLPQLSDIHIYMSKGMNRVIESESFCVWTPFSL